MPLTTFEIESLDQVDDGSVALALNQALRAAFMDCKDRPELKKPRNVNLVVSMKPEMERGDLRFVRVGFEIKKAFPSQGVEVMMKPADNSLEFNPAAPENPNVNTLPFEENQ